MKTAVYESIVGVIPKEVLSFFWYDNDKDLEVGFPVTRLIHLGLDLLQEKLESEQKKKKETENELRNLGEEVKELEPRHTELKQRRDDTKKAFKTAQVRLVICQLSAGSTKSIGVTVYKKLFLFN